MPNKNNRQELEKHLAQLSPYHPERRAAVISAMQVLQAERGYLDDEAVIEVARLTNLSTTEVEELASFYSLIYRRPVGQHVLRICDSLCCALTGADQLLATAQKHSGVSLGQVTPDGILSVLPSICLGLCDRAPAALLDAEAVCLLDEFKLKLLLDRLRGED